MKVLLTGADGMLGSDLSPVLENAGYDVIETNKNQMDIIDSECVSDIVSEIKPDIVIHCAAYTNVDRAEVDYENAYKINVVGTENVANAANNIGAICVYISTDYVFDGKKNTPYTTLDKPHPINSYGLTKLKGEEAVQKKCTKYHIVRTSWLYGHHGKNFVETMLSLRNKEEIRVVDDQTGCPTWTVELAEGIIKILDMPYGIHHICGSGFASWYDFAKEIFKIEGLNVNLLPCKSEDYPLPAKRPKYSIMDNHGLCRDWRCSLKDYLALRVED